MIGETKSKFITLEEMITKHKFVKKNTIKYLIKTNPEFKKRCVGKLGKVILIKEQEFLKYIDEYHVD